MIIYFTLYSLLYSVSKCAFNEAFLFKQEIKTCLCTTSNYTSPYEPLQKENAEKSYFEMESRLNFKAKTVFENR